MTRTTRLHAASGGVALLLIATFWISTVLVETLGSDAQIATVKTAILIGFSLLLPALATAGLTGNRLAAGWLSKPVARKQRRMKVAATNGVLILVPSAVFLAWKASNLGFDGWFAAVQAVELVAGVVNITLLVLNLRDGLRLGTRRATA